MKLFLALILTIVIEEFVVMLCYPFFKEGGKYYQISIYVLLCNLITNPSLNILIAFFTVTQFVYIIILEIIVIVIEWWLLYLLSSLSKSKALVLSIVLNVSSYLLGRCII